MIHGFDFLLKSNPNVSKRPNTILMSKMSNVSNIGTFSSKRMVTFTAPPETWRASSWVHIKPQCFSHHLDCYANAMQMLCIDYWFCVRWCAQPLRCTRHIGRGSLLKWLCSPVWVGRFWLTQVMSPNAKRWKGSRDWVAGHVTSRGRHRACDRQVGGAKEKHGSYRRHAGVWQLWRHAGWSRKEGEAPNSWCGGSSPTASSSGILVGGSMASSLEDIPQSGLWAGGSV